MIRKFLLSAIALLFILESSYYAKAQDGDASPDAGLKMGGYLQADDRLLLKGNNEFTWQEYRLDFQAEAKPNDKVKFYSEVWFRSLGFPIVQNSSDLRMKDKVSPWSLDIREAYFDIYGFLLEKIDIRIGRQRIAWGTADKFNPTDNLNPDDLEDIFDFGRHLGSDAIKISLYPWDFTFTIAYIPIFTPAVLPAGEMASILSSPPAQLSKFRLRNISDTVILPSNNPKASSTIGIKIGKSIFNYDFSLSYMYGRDDLPLVHKTAVKLINPTNMTADMDIEIVYPRMQAAGMDIAGEIGGIGIWAEAAVFFPEKKEMITDLSGLGQPVQKSTLLEKPYTKYVAGFDYTFKNGIYLNGQYLHGFIHERGEGNLEDYIMLGCDFKLFDDKLKIAPLAGAAEIKDFKHIKENYALIYSPSISFYPVDNAELSLGLLEIDGKSTTAFGKAKESDQFYFKAKYNF